MPKVIIKGADRFPDKEVTLAVNGQVRKFPADTVIDEMHEDYVEAARNGGLDVEVLGDEGGAADAGVADFAPKSAADVVADLGASAPDTLVESTAGDASDASGDPRLKDGPEPLASENDKPLVVPGSQQDDGSAPLIGTETPVAPKSDAPKPAAKRASKPKATSKK